ncbi:hypothetical protein BFJ69_g15856 [Fusarium oxysporum]|uniref:Uncharacterized protein n=1 Tax=Fusarium oxysporum TaxID=5507 RepID=A0A420MD04_FUSOX|nr:hypothetical protein BFJ69_g15856 [Fusarium oxysporum]
MCSGVQNLFQLLPFMLEDKPNSMRKGAKTCTWSKGAKTCTWSKGAKTCTGREC